MNEKGEPIFENEEFLLLLQKYEKMKDGQNSLFFDVEEFEQIIDYYLDEFQYEDATMAAELGTIQHPASVEIKYKIVHIFLEEGEPAKALEVINDIPNWEHSNPEFHYLKGTAMCQSGKVHEAERSFDTGLSLATDDKFEALLNIAVAFENIRNFKLAIKYLEQANSINSNFLSVLYDLGYFYERQDDFKKSIYYYQLYLDQDPFSENVWYNLGVVYFKMNMMDKAIEAYDYSIAINPDYASAYFNKANTWASMGNYKKAIISFTDFIEIEPENTQALCFLGDCYEQAEEFDKALLTYKKLIEIDNTDPEGWFGAGMVLYQQNVFDQAAAYILKALEFDAQNTDYWINLGYVYEEAGRSEEALRCYRQITKIDQNDKEAWNALSSLLLKAGEYEAALRDLRGAYTIFPADEYLSIKMAVAHLKLENTQLCIKFLESSLKRNTASLSEFKIHIPEEEWGEDIRTLVLKYTN